MSTTLTGPESGPKPLRRTTRTRRGDSARASAGWPGLFHAHVGWLFNRELSNRERFAPDLLADPITRGVDRLFPALVAVSPLGPAAMGGLLTWPWQGLTVFFRGGPVRIALLRQATWAIDSVCHGYGERTAKLVDPGRVPGVPPG
jgi:fatty-acid desaturase